MKILVKKDNSPLITPERGAISVLAAGSLIAIIGMSALAIDIGNVMVEKNHMQNAIDSGALHAAASLYANGTGPNFQTAGNSGRGGPAYIATNQNMPLSPDDQFSVTSNYWQTLNPNAPNNDAAVKISLTHKANTFFANLVGVPSMSITDTAVAIMAPANFELERDGRRVKPASVPILFVQQRIFNHV